MKRVLESELLDSMSPDEPEARRSRRDLRLINFLMGNERWIMRRIIEQPDACAKGIVEWGAGDGSLLKKMFRFGYAMGVDLMPRPDDLPEKLKWHQGDVLETSIEGGVLVSNLFLHHFDDDGLDRLGKLASRFQCLLFVEPLRTKSSLVLGWGMLPFVNRVTRHDMLVSIRAGFQKGELLEKLGLDPTEWKVSERCSWRGGLRVLVCRA